MLSVFSGEVPFWMYSTLGKEVRLIDGWNDGLRVHRAGSVGLLQMLRVMDDGSKRALVVFEDDPQEDLVDVPFSYLRPLEDFEVAGDAALAKMPHRLQELVLAWRHGFDLRKRMAKGTFYRYRKELLSGYGIDISLPAVSVGA